MVLDYNQRDPSGGVSHMTGGVRAGRVNDDRVHVDTMAAEHTTASSSPHARRTDTAFRNHDLKAEAREAQKPTVRFAFEFPELPVAFEAADEVASTSRDRNRRLGVLPCICSKAPDRGKGNSSCIARCREQTRECRAAMVVLYFVYYNWPCIRFDKPVELTIRTAESGDLDAPRQPYTHLKEKQTRD